MLMPGTDVRALAVPFRIITIPTWITYLGFRYLVSDLEKFGCR
jgi:hypothetical protein